MGKLICAYRSRVGALCESGIQKRLAHLAGLNGLWPLRPWTTALRARFALPTGCATVSALRALLVFSKLNFRKEKLKKAPQGREAGRGLGGRAPPGSGAVVNACAGGGRSGVNAQRCPRRPRAAALSTAERATGRSGRGCLAVPHSAYYVQSEKQQAAKPRKT